VPFWRSQEKAKLLTFSISFNFEYSKQQQAHYLITLNSKKYVFKPVV